MLSLFPHVLIDILFVADTQFGGWMREGNQACVWGGGKKQLFSSVGAVESKILKLQPSLGVMQEADCLSGFLF
jgi:hypothetical protein